MEELDMGLREESSWRGTVSYRPVPSRSQINFKVCLSFIASVVISTAASVMVVHYHLGPPATVRRKMFCSGSIQHLTRTCRLMFYAACHWLYEASNVNEGLIVSSSEAEDRTSFCQFKLLFFYRLY